MSRSGMNVKQFNEVMKRCKEIPRVRYVTPTIHPGAGVVVSFVLHTVDKSIELTITNNPDENFDLFVAVNKELDDFE